jgi:hypothetical protein
MIPLPVSCLEHIRLNYRPRVASTTLGAVLLNYGETLKLIEAIAYCSEVRDRVNGTATWSMSGAACPWVSAP